MKGTYKFIIILMVAIVLGISLPAVADDCESVQFQVTPDEVVMIVDLNLAGINDLEGQNVLAHSNYLNNTYGYEKDVLAQSLVENGKLVFRFKNRQVSERIWFSVPELNRWIVPCSRFLYPDSKGNNAIEVIFSSNEIKRIEGEWEEDVPEKLGTPDVVYKTKE